MVEYSQKFIDNLVIKLEEEQKKKELEEKEANEKK